MFILAAATTCGVSFLVWLAGRWADLRLIRRRRAQLAGWSADPTTG